MSFKAELEALIANANSSLEDLEAVLSRAHLQSGDGDTSDRTNGDIGEIQTQIDTIRKRILSSLLEIQECYKHDQERLDDLGGELKLDLENVRRCAIDYFIKEDYRECERLLTFLAKVQPRDENLENLLNLSRRKQVENEQKGRIATVANGSNSTGREPEPALSLENHSQSNQDIPHSLGNGREPPSGMAPGTLDSPPLDGVQADPAAQSETIGPQILAKMKLNTAAHIDEMYRTLRNPAKPHFLAWVTVAGFLFASTLFWIATHGEEDAAPHGLLSPRPEGEDLALPKDSLANLHQDAQALFDAGNLREAGRVCDVILSREPQNIFAVALKDQIQVSLADPKTQTKEVMPGGTVQLPQTRIGQPLGRSSSVQDPNQSLKSDAPLLESSTYQPLDSKGDAKTPKSTKQTPPVKSPLLAKQTAVTTPASVVPAIPVASRVATTPQISADALLELNRKLEAKDFDQARLLLERLAVEAPGNSEVRTLSERLKVEAGKQQSLALSWLEKAEVAWIAGRYVTPLDDNVLVYCNLSLKADPKNQRAANLKKEIVQRAVAQAKDWIQRGKFDAARMSFASMDFLAAGDNSFPYPRADLKRELEKLGFTNYSIIHDHKLGSCSGTLKFNAYAVSYVPAGGSGDGFTETLNSIVINEEGERLKIVYRDKTLRFRSERGNAVQSIYQQLVSRMTDEKSILATREKDVRNR